MKVKIKPIDIGGLMSENKKLKELLKTLSEEMNKIGCDNSCDMCEQGDYSECHGTFRWKHNDEVEEVVRCKECCFYREAHYEDEGKGKPPYIKHVCTIFKCQIQLDGYCSLAERKDGEQNA